MFQTVLTVAGVAILVAILWVARDALLLIYVSALLAMGIAPLVRLLEQPSSRGRHFRLPRWLAILVIYLAVIGVVTVLGLLIVPPLVGQATALWKRLPDELNRLQGFLIGHGLMTRNVTLAEAVSQAPSGTGSDAVGTVLVAVSSVIGGVFALITILILSFYLSVESEAMFDGFAPGSSPAGRRGDLATAAKEAVQKVSAWLGAQLLLAGVMGTFAAVGLGLMGVPYFYVIALVAAIGETIPIIGPIIGGATAVAVAISVSPKLALIVGGYFLVLHQLEANVLVPKIMERRVGVSPVAVMVALLVGGSVHGLAGAILAIPTAAILSIILDEIATERAARLQRVK